MFIRFWGTHRVESKLKPAEAFCPIHHALHDFELRAVRMRPHINGISFGKGQTVGHVIRTIQPCGYQLGPNYRTSTFQQICEWHLVSLSRLAWPPVPCSSKSTERRAILTDVLAGATYAQNGPASDEVARAAARPLVGALALAIVLSVLIIMLHLPGKAFYVILGLVMARPIWAILARNRLAKGSGLRFVIHPRRPAPGRCRRPGSCRNKASAGEGFAQHESADLRGVVVKLTDVELPAPT
jgi:hypothetical protein